MGGGKAGVLNIAVVLGHLFDHSLARHSFRDGPPMLLLLLLYSAGRVTTNSWAISTRVLAATCISISPHYFRQNLLVKLKKTSTKESRLLESDKKPQHTSPHSPKLAPNIKIREVKV